MLIQFRKGEYFWKCDEQEKDFMGSFYLKDMSRNMFSKGPVAEIWSFGIYGRYRCQGYGQKMLREAIELAGDKALMLYVHKDNEIAIHVYKKAGFQVVGKLGTLAWAMAYSGNEAGQEIIKYAVYCV